MSLRAELNVPVLPDERLLTDSRAKVPQPLAGRIPAAVRLMVISWNLLLARATFVSGFCAMVRSPLRPRSPSFAAPSAVAGLRLTWFSQHGGLSFESAHVPVVPACHVSSVIVALVPPAVKSNVISLSPVLRTGVLPFELSVPDWFSSTFKLAEPLGATLS